MRIPRHAAALAAIVLATAAVANAFAYAKLLQGDERHRFGGVGEFGPTGTDSMFGPVPHGNQTLIVVPVRDGSQHIMPGTLVRIESDGRAFIPTGLDLAIVPAGQGGRVLADPSTVTFLAKQGPVEPQGTWIPAPPRGNASHIVIAGPGSPQVDLAQPLVAEVPEPAPGGVVGVDVVWYNVTTWYGGPGMTYSMTYVDTRFVHAAPVFLGAELALAALAAAAVVAWARARRPAQQPVAEASAVADLVRAAGGHLRSLRNALLVGGVLLAATLVLGQDALERVLDDETPDRVATQAATLAYDAGAAVLVAAWAAMAWQAHQAVRRWRTFMAAPPLQL